jgi:hypothetical protein
MTPGMNALSAAGLADLAGVTEAEVQRLVDLGILVARDGVGPFLETDVQKVRLATACQQAGLPMAGIAAAIRPGRLSFTFLEAAVYRRWRVRSGRTYRQVSQDTGVPLELLGSALEAIGFARMAPDEPIREDELEIVPLLQLGLSSGFLDQLWSTRLGRGYQQGLRLIAQVEKELWQARFMAPMLAAGADRQGAMERAAQRAADLNFTPCSTVRCWPPTAASRSWPGSRAWSRTSRPRWTPAACSGGPSGCRRCASWTWWATPASPRSTATRPRPSWPAGWRCWSAARRATTAACR